MHDAPSPHTAVAGRFAERVAVVTGAASGIGLAITRRFVAEGGVVIAGDVQQDLLDRLVAEHEGFVVARRTDVTVESEVEALVGLAVERYGAVHAMFNVAGASRGALLTDLSEDDWDFTVDLCLKGVFLGIKHAARRMLAAGTRGAIVNIASLNSRVPMFFGGAYAAAKAGVVSLGQTAALELGEAGIRVTTVSPGLTDTPLVSGFTGIPNVRDAFLRQIPLKRPATPEDIAAAALFLASDDAAYITGSNLFVDGGWEQTAYPDLRPLVADLAAARTAAEAGQA